jgi:Ethanolamine utilization protein EutJ (predicted chaperonin)
MKNKGLIYILLAGGAILLLSMKKKGSYKIEVPAPEKITAEQFRQPSLIQKVSKVVKKVAPVVKKAVKAAKQKRSMKIGQFPDMC